MQTAKTVLMVRPAAFRANPETMKSNLFQKPMTGVTDVANLARAAFDGYVASLRNAGVDVRIIEDIPLHETPDSLFPNNWIVMLAGGTIFTFPMEAHNRRRERRMDIIADLSKDYEVLRRIDLTHYEEENLYLEGTGSLILDHDNYIAYACRSSRSSEVVGQEFERLSGYRIYWFNARDRLHHPIYHTNVMMSVGSRFAIVCLESLTSEKERHELVELLVSSGKTIISVTFEQMESFACNVLEVTSRDGHPVYAISTRAWASFTPEQQTQLNGYARLALAPIDIIEELGGGGARCMVAEVFLEKKTAIV